MRVPAEMSVEDRLETSSNGDPEPVRHQVLAKDPYPHYKLQDQNRFLSK